MALTRLVNSSDFDCAGVLHALPLCPCKTELGEHGDDEDADLPPLMLYPDRGGSWAGE